MLVNNLVVCCSDRLWNNLSSSLWSYSDRARALILSLLHLWVIALSTEVAKVSIILLNINSILAGESFDQNLYVPKNSFSLDEEAFLMQTFYFDKFLTNSSESLRITLIQHWDQDNWYLTSYGKKILSIQTPDWDLGNLGSIPLSVTTFVWIEARPMGPDFKKSLGTTLLNITIPNY